MALPRPGSAPETVLLANRLFDQFRAASVERRERSLSFKLDFNQ